MIISRQKTFGLIGKLAYKLCDKLGKKNEDLNNQLESYDNKSKSKESKQLSRKLIKFIKDQDVDVINERRGGAYAVDVRGNELSSFDNDVEKKSRLLQWGVEHSRNPNYKKTDQYRDDLKQLKTAMRQRKAVVSGKGYINVHADKTPLGVIGHEGFHILGKKKFNAGNVKSKKATQISKELPTSRIDALKKSLQIGYNYIPELREEAKASRGSIRWLKKNNASKDLIKSERRNLRNAFGTYVSENLRQTLLPIARYKNKSIVKDIKHELSKSVIPTFTEKQGKTINTVYRRGGKF